VVLVSRESGSGEAKNLHLLPMPDPDLKKPMPKRNLSRRRLLEGPVIVKKPQRKMEQPMALLLLQMVRVCLQSLLRPKSREVLHRMPMVLVVGDVEEVEGEGGAVHRGLDDDLADRQ